MTATSTAPADAPVSKEDAAKKLAYKHFSLGLAMMNHARYEKAEEAFLEALKIEPKSYNCRIYLARVYLNEKKRKTYQAIEQYKEAIKIDPARPHAYDGLIDVYIDMLLFNDAVKVGEQAITAGVPDDGAFATTLGWAYYAAGEYDKAVEQYRIVRAKNPEDSGTYNNEGLARYCQEKYEDALAMFKKAGEMNPASEVAPYFCALTYMKLGREAEAMDAIRAGMKLSNEFEKNILRFGGRFFPVVYPGDLKPLVKKVKGESSPSDAAAKSETKTEPESEPKTQPVKQPVIQPDTQPDTQVEKK